MKILLFGKLGASMGRELELNHGGPKTVAEVRSELSRLYPESARDLEAARARACVNDEVAEENRAVGPCDEIAFLPPLSGG